MDLSKYFSEDWYRELKDYAESSEFEDIAWNIAKERENRTIYPIQGDENFLKVFRVTPLAKVKCVIIGQCPYPEGSYDGLAFSNRETKAFASPSLRNILKEVERDIYDGFDLKTRSSISLYRWAEQGALLLNVAHTVVKDTPGSHLHYWKDFTNKVVEVLSNKDNVIWLLWGNHAHKLKDSIVNPTHTVIKTTHPSPYSYSTSHGKIQSFKNSGMFSKVNDYLKEKNIEPIYW